MNARILLITAIICQALMPYGVPEMRSVECEAIIYVIVAADAPACAIIPSEQCESIRLRSHGIPIPEPPDRPDCRCCFCVFIEAAPALPPTPSEQRLVGSATDALAGEPSFPILTGVFAGAHGNIARPPPPSAALRRAMLCCWTT